MINLKNKDSVAAKVEEILQQEALKGKQHKIDKNHNKKIDSQDFAILRGEKKANEEVEQIDEGGIGDLPNRGMTGSDTKGPFGVYHHDGGPGAGKLKIVSKHKTLDSALKHVNKLTKKSGKNDHFYGHLASHQPDQGKIPSQFHEEVEQIDEISKSTLGSYVKSAARDVGASRKLAADFENKAEKSRKPSAKAAATRLSDKFKVTALKRHVGIGKAVERLTKEEAEQVTEREMTKGETTEKERIVKGMKKSLSGFKARYGDRANNVMYATATKQAMKEEEQVDENAFDWKTPKPPESKGGAGVKQGRAYGGAAQKSKPEQEDNNEKKK